MGRSSNGLEVPEETNGGSITGCSIDENQDLSCDCGDCVGETEIKGRVFPLKEVLEMIDRKCQDYDQGAAGSGEGGISYFCHVFSGKGWELKELRMLINRCLNGDFKTFSQVYDHVFLIKIFLDGGATRGSEGGFAHLTQCEVDEVMLQTNALLDLIGDFCNFAGRQSNLINKGCKADEFEQAICKGGVPHMAGKQIKSTRGGEGDTAHLAGLQIKPLVSSFDKSMNLTRREVDELTLHTNALFYPIDSCNFSGRQSNPLISSLSKGCEGDEFERLINVMLNWAAARGGKLDQPEVDKLARHIKEILARGGEGDITHSGTNMRNRPTESHCVDIDEGDNYQLPDSAPLNNMSSSPANNPDGAAHSGTNMQQYRPTESHCVDIDEGDNYLPDSAPLNNMFSSPANNPDGSSHSRTSMQQNRPSSLQDINDGENQEQKLKILEWSTPMNIIMFSTAVGITSSLPKYLPGIGLVLVAINFVFLVLRAFLPLKYMKLVTNVAFTCNVTGFFLFVVICLSKSDLWK